MIEGVDSDIESNLRFKFIELGIQGSGNMVIFLPLTSSIKIYLYIVTIRNNLNIRD